MTQDRGRFTSRTKARKRAAEVLFEADQRGSMESTSDLLSLLEERKTFTASPAPLPPYAIQIVEGVASNRPEIDAVLRKHAKGAGIDRIPAVDLAVMRVAVWEMLGNAMDVPPIVAIDEAVAVVKQISTDDSPAFVNAVLDAARKEMDDPWGRQPVSLEEGVEAVLQDAAASGEQAEAAAPAGSAPADLSADSLDTEAAEQASWPALQISVPPEDALEVQVEDDFDEDELLDQY